MVFAIFWFERSVGGILKSNVWFISNLRIFYALILVDFSGDHMILQELDGLEWLINPIRNGIIFGCILCALNGFFDLFRIKTINNSGLYSALTILMTLVYGLLFGVLENSTTHAFREALCMAPLVFTPTFLRLSTDEKVRFAIFVCKLIMFTCFFKIVLVQLVRLIFWGDVSWKVFLRESPLLIFPYMYYLFKVLSKQATSRDLIIMMFTIIAILAAEARALNFTIISATAFFILRTYNAKKAMQFLLLFLVATAIAMIITGNEFKNILGHWSGEHYENSATYRLEQLDMLYSRFASHPFRGYGFGYFTPGYNGYEDLELPYLLELDLINFASKIGLPLFILYISGYVIFALRYHTVRYFEHIDRHLYCAITTTIIALLFYSFYQTAHSSLTYWAMYALCFGLLFGTRSLPINLKGQYRE